VWWEECGCAADKGCSSHESDTDCLRFHTPTTPNDQLSPAIPRPTAINKVRTLLLVLSRLHSNGRLHAAPAAPTALVVESLVGALYEATFLCDGGGCDGGGGGGGGSDGGGSDGGGGDGGGGNVAGGSGRGGASGSAAVVAAAAGGNAGGGGEDVGDYINSWIEATFRNQL